MTRAIVCVRDPENTWRIYVHADGYPTGLGQVILDFIDWALRHDPNLPKNSLPSLEDPDAVFAYNSAIAAEKMAADLIWFILQRYHPFHSVYLTTRDPVEEARRGGTDIDWYYILTIEGEGKIRAEALRMELHRPAWKAPQPLRLVVAREARLEALRRARWQAELAEKEKMDALV